MKFPKINKQPLRTVTVPDLAGGVNMRDGLTDVADNQLTECKNMWFKDGVLRTRCGLDVGENGIFELGQAVDSEYTTRLFENIKNTADGRDYILSAVEQHSKWYKDEELCESTAIYFNWVGDKNNISLGHILSDKYNESCFVCLQKSVLYCYMSNHKIYKLTALDGSGEWSEVSDDEIYVPTYMTNVRALAGNYYELEGDQFEEVNLIGNKLKYYCTSVNPGVTDNGSRVMLYYFIIPEVDWIDRVTLRWSGTDIEHTVEPVYSEDTPNKYTHWEENYSRNNERMAVQFATSSKGKITNFLIGIQDRDNEKNSNEGVYRGTETEATKFKKITTSDVVPENNMEITVTYTLTAEEDKKRDKVFSMTRAEWFGGASSGIRGGTRLMLCGNAKEGEKNLVMYSDLNRPLYFSENSYFYVGDSTSAVTGFGKQSDMLVIFKENETYFTRYNQAEISAEDLINQKVIDYAASSVYFPLTLIHSSIGCDLPDTVQLCRNRLVWATRDGGIYTLTSDNQYSERNIYEVGEMIKRALPTRLPESASACDRNGYYVLLCGDKAFLMDYNSSGYQYIYSYQKNEGANIKIPWYCWKFDFAENPLSLLTPKIGTVGGALTVAGVYDGVKAALVVFTSKDRDTDTRIEEGETELLRRTVPISCGFTTKLFDFGAASYRKNVPLINILFGNNGGYPINVTFVTDCGKEQAETVVLSGNEFEAYSPEYIHNRQFRPCIRLISRIGIKVECEGTMIIDGISLDYRILGGAR